MRKFPRSLAVMLLALVVIIGGGLALMNMEVPPPAQPYEKQLTVTSPAAR